MRIAIKGAVALGALLATVAQFAVAGPVTITATGTVTLETRNLFSIPTPSVLGQPFTISTIFDQSNVIQIGGDCSSVSCGYQFSGGTTTFSTQGFISSHFNLGGFSTIGWNSATGLSVRSGDFTGETFFNVSPSIAPIPNPVTFTGSFSTPAGPPRGTYTGGVFGTFAGVFGTPDPPFNQVLGTVHNLSINVAKEKPTIVLTHGYSPGRSLDQPSYMEELVQPILNNLARNGKTADDVNIVVLKWEQAYPLALTPGTYNDSAKRVEEAGFKLAKELVQQLGPGYQSDLHFIGHSLGAAVNANIVKALSQMPGVSQAINVSEFTILDYPKFPIIGRPDGPNDSIRTFDTEYFQRSLSPSIVKYVDNYFGSLDFVRSVGVDAPGFGAAMPGAGPLLGGVSDLCGADGRSACGHTGVWQDMYQAIINDQRPGYDWTSPALANVPTNMPWRVPSIIGESIADKIPADKFNPLTGIYNFKNDIVDGVEITIIELEEGSPSAVIYSVPVGRKIKNLHFAFNIESLGDGDWFEVLYGEFSVWEFHPDAEMEFYFNVDIDLSAVNLIGADLIWYLHSVGDRNAKFRFGDVALSYQSDNPISEPPILYTLLSMVIMMYINRIRRKFSGSSFISL